MPRAALVLLAVLLAGCTSPSREVGPLVGNLAPPFALDAVDDGPWSLQAQRGKVVLLDLMGVNCPPCRREMPHLVAFAQAHAGDAGLSMVSVDMASVFPALGARDAGEIRAFRGEFNATWPFAPDARGDVGRAYQVLILPTKVVIDGEGVIRAKLSKEIAGVQELEDAVAAARPRAGEGAPAGAGVR